MRQNPVTVFIKHLPRERVIQPYQLPANAFFSSFATNVVVGFFFFFIHDPITATKQQADDEL